MLSSFAGLSVRIAMTRYTGQMMWGCTSAGRSFCCTGGASAGIYFLNTSSRGLSTTGDCSSGGRPPRERALALSHLTCCVPPRFIFQSKSICNKFPQSSPITCMSWPEMRPNDVVFGLAEGKVKIGQLKSNKPATLYNVDSFCAALATSPDGNGVVSAHADGTLYRFLFDDNG